jgi:ferredoxin-type protein NapG
MNRKDFFKEAYQRLIQKGLNLFHSNPIIDALESCSGKPITTKKKQRPPGASPTDSRFQKSCTGCDACMIACPVNVIMIEDLEKRLPLIFLEEAPCIQCADTPCITACPTQALNLTNGIELRFLD